MITKEQLAEISITRVIFHDIPKHLPETDEKPRFSQAVSQLDYHRIKHLRKKLNQALTSAGAYPVAFQESASSIVPSEVRSATKPENGQGDGFIEMSQRLGQALFDMQYGTVSAGLLCVMEVASGGRPGVILMKIEREEGARLEFVERDGKLTFDMSILDNLVLTENTRLFKTGLFIRTGPDDSDFDILACDTQLEDMAKFWLRFLSCHLIVEPRIATRRFFEATRDFINDVVTDPIQKDDLYEHLHSQLKAERKIFSPRTFMQEYVPAKLRDAFKEHLRKKKLDLASFDKDLSEIKSKMRRRAYYGEHGTTITAPSEEAERIEVQRDQVVVKDILVKIDEK